MADTVIRPNGKWQGGDQTVGMWIPSVRFVRPFMPLYRPRIYYRPTTNATNLSVGRPTTDARALRLEFRIACVSAHARGFQPNSPLSVHRSIDASFAKRCLFQVARNFNWSGGIDRSAKTWISRMHNIRDATLSRSLFNSIRIENRKFRWIRLAIAKFSFYFSH